ncbi:MAG: D-alanine--D-alanine ligase [Gemmatimonadota bacterium]|jgi:D-alanine-D-alanine ligase|nr:D-alanine--D-alanine ligase [Gemmatimonadota bacterium]MDQ8155191.1 D-alanine--D-alanine ligase [Gemmatimonadota bacterium]MDQ8156608.1 D-alanine--D-alanine ligase [Gemmatimonadota bacterium]
MRILVLLGGASAEREVSLASGTRVADALRQKGHDVTTADPGADPLAILPDARAAEVVWMALHGGAGEDGTIQALFDLAGVRYTGSGHLASALAMDKDLSKQLFRAAGVPTAEWRMVRTGDGTDWTAPAFTEEMIAALGLPLVVKPSKQGSTVGLTVVKAAAQLAPAVTEAFHHDDEVMLEAFVPGRELTVGVLADAPMPVGEIIPKHELYDYECKYTPGMAEEIFPAAIPDDVRDAAQRQAMAAYRALKLAGCARIDFRLHPTDGLFCLEANTLPGMTGTSLVPQAAAAMGMDFPTLCERIALAVAR